jgi:hypothetical protein
MFLNTIDEKREGPSSIMRMAGGSIPEYQAAKHKIYPETKYVEGVIVN